VTFVKDPDGNFTGNTMLALNKLSLKSHDVYMLKESKTERVIDFEERPDYRVR
jgi:hypothetical protein